MHLTQEEIDSRGLHLRTWFANMQQAATAQPRPTFTIKGPMQLTARMRPKGTMEATHAIHSFMGGERFYFHSATAEVSAQDGSVGISVLMTAGAASLAARGVTSVTLPLDEAMEVFDGMESFVTQHARNATTSNLAAIDGGRFTPAWPSKPARPAVIDNPMRGTW